MLNLSCFPYAFSFHLIAAVRFDHHGVFLNFVKTAIPWSLLQPSCERELWRFGNMATLCRILLSTFVVILGIGFYCLHTCLNPDADPPQLPRDGWWGRGKAQQDTDDSVKEFQINVSDDLLIDLQQRLSNFRFGEDLENADFNYGFQNSYMKEIVDYWKDQYNWREQERRLNQYQHYITKIEGIYVHFLRARPGEKSARMSCLRWNIHA